MFLSKHLNKMEIKQKCKYFLIMLQNLLILLIIHHFNHILIIMLVTLNIFIYLMLNMFIIS